MVKFIKLKPLVSI